MAFNFTGFLTYPVGGNYLGEYLNAGLVFIVTLMVLKFFKYVIIRKLKDKTAKTKTKLDKVVVEIIDKVGWLFYVLVSLYLSLQFVEVPKILSTISYYLVVIAATYYAVGAAQRLIDYFTQKGISSRKKEGEEDASFITSISKLFKLSLWFIALLLILENLGYDISALVAGLGIGGIAIALGLQAILGDVFASFSIYFDKPFREGDFIIVGEDLGVVRKIGIKSTRVQTLQGEELIISNKELTESRVHNYKKMEKRRVAFKLGVTYQTSSKKLKKIPKIIREIITKVKLAKIDRVHFREFSDSSLNFEVVYYANTGDYNKYMDIQQEINLAIKERFEKEGIEFAYPTQTLFVNS